MYYLGTKRLPLDIAFSDREGFQYPAEWLRNSSPQQRKALGITEAKGSQTKKPKIDPPKYTPDQRQEDKEEACLTRFINCVMLGEFNNVFIMTVEEVKAEVQLLNLDNIRKFPCSRSKTEDFYTMWQRFGPEAARTAMIPVIWDGTCPRPTEFFGNGQA